MKFSCKWMAPVPVVDAEGSFNCTMYFTIHDVKADKKKCSWWRLSRSIMCVGVEDYMFLCGQLMKLTFLVFVNSQAAKSRICWGCEICLSGRPHKRLFTMVQFGGWSRNWQVVSICLRVEDSDLKRLLTWVDIAKH